jgi:hypothetical protein
MAGFVVLLLFLRLLDLLVHQLDYIVQFVKVQLVVALERLIILRLYLSLAFFPFYRLSLFKFKESLL